MHRDEFYLLNMALSCSVDVANSNSQNELGTEACPVDVSSTAGWVTIGVGDPKNGYTYLKE